MAIEVRHPLQKTVDQIIEDELGTELVAGVQISLTSFERIRNKEYVRRRLEQRGFNQIKGSTIRYSYQIIIDESLPSCRKYSKEDVLNRFKHKHGVISNEGLKLSERNKLSRTITYLRRTGYVIESKKDWSKKVGTSVTIYKLKTSDNCELSEAC